MRPHTTIFSGAFLALCLAASNGVAANTSPSQHLNTSPSQHLNTSTSQHQISPSQHLTISTSTLTTKRPAPAERLFVSDAVEKKIREIKKRIKDKNVMITAGPTYEKIDMRVPCSVALREELAHHGLMGEGREGDGSDELLAGWRDDHLHLSAFLDEPADDETGLIG